MNPNNRNNQPNRPNNNRPQRPLHRIHYGQSVYTPPLPTARWPYNFSQEVVRKKNQQAQKNFFTKVKNQDMELFDDYHPFRNAFFSNAILNFQAGDLFGVTVVQTLEQDTWRIEIKMIEEGRKWEKIFGLMKQCQAKVLDMKIDAKIFYPNLFESIGNIDFSELVDLNLYECHIQNIEALTFLDAPKLKRINLIYNGIMQYKSLKKAIFPLKQLYLTRMIVFQRNFRQQAPNVRLDNYGRWNCTLEDLRLEKHNYNPVIMQDLSFVAKAKRIEGIPIKYGISKLTRIKQRSTMRRLCRQGIARFQIWDHIDPVINGFPPDQQGDQEIYVPRQERG